MLGKLHLFGFCLLIGAAGLQWFYVRTLSAVPSWLVWTGLLLPWITIHVITFCQRAPFGPRSFRRCLLAVVIAYALLTIVAEVIQSVRPLPADGNFTLTLARVLTYIGCLTFVPFTHAYLLLRKSEVASDA